MKLVDTHAHLTFKEFAGDVPAVLDRAWQAGLEAIVLIGAGNGLAGNYPALELAETDARLFATVGIHPHDTGSAEERWMQEIKQLAAAEKVVALGEIGLDFHYPDPPHAVQLTWFRRQLELAHELELPIIIHDRDAHEEIWQTILDVGLPPRRGIFHCFSGDLAFAERVIAAGFLLGIGGIVTFKNATLLHEVVAAVPIESLVIETDCPYLAPVPQRGKRNEPALVSHIATRIAEIKGMTLQEVSRLTTHNATRHLRLLESRSRMPSSSRGIP